MPDGTSIRQARGIQFQACDSSHVIINQQVQLIHRFADGSGRFFIGQLAVKLTFEQIELVGEVVDLLLVFLDALFGVQGDILCA